MSFEFEIPVAWVVWGALFLGGVNLLFGIFTAVWPERSIGLYVWLMARINWRVAPMDEAREVRTTRRFGVWLILLSIGLFIAVSR